MSESQLIGYNKSSKKEMHFMTDLYNYLSSKCLETASTELVKQAILEDMTLSPLQKQNWISLINTMSAAKNMADICKILSGRM